MTEWFIIFYKFLLIVTTFLILGTTFNYDSSATTREKTELETLVNTTISNYNRDELKH